MTYTELRAAITANISDRAALMALLTAENVRTVEACAPGVGVPATYQPGSSSSTYFAGQDIALAMYDKPPAFTVDEVLVSFSPANIYAVQVYARAVQGLDYANENDADFLDAVDASANQTEPLLC
jgi:hypothetical protein